MCFVTQYDIGKFVSKVVELFNCVLEKHVHIIFALQLIKGAEQPRKTKAPKHQP
jgi:hypothetical protein